MALANCSECGKLFNRAVRDICPDCIRLEETRFITIRNYIKEHSRVSAQEIAEGTDVPLNLVLRFLREGRLTVSARSVVTYPCKACGESIDTGQYCGTCTRQLKSELSRVSRAEPSGHASSEWIDVKSKPARSSAYHSTLRKGD